MSVWYLENGFKEENSEFRVRVPGSEFRVLSSGFVETSNHKLGVR